MSIRVLLVDDHALARKGLVSLVSSMADTLVVGEAASGREALRRIEKLCPSIVLMDVSMKDRDGVSTTREITVRFPDCRVIGLSMHEDEFIARQMFRAGAKGYIAKSAPIEEIIAGIYAVNCGDSFLSSNFNPSVLESDSGAKAEPLSAERMLTSREREVLQLVAIGFSSKKIAWELEISEKTVAYHRQHLMKKLQLFSVAELTKYAMYEGLIETMKRVS